MDKETRTPLKHFEKDREGRSGAVKQVEEPVAKASSTDLITKYRPKTFDEVIGQEAVVASLKGVLKKESAHAFIFVGPPGCGKTTIARIIARKKGCSKGNLVEVDAATHSGVEAMRAITDTLQYAALGGGTRAIIVDECQRLSPAAWSSLLKTVEEPPPNVYWVFCTTEVGKIPQASATRCASYQLKPVSTNDIRELLDKVVDAEGLDTPDDILSLIASKSDGSPRRALSGLSKCASCQDRKEAAELMQVVTDEDEGDVGNLCRALIKGGLNWERTMQLVAPLKDLNPESVRIVVVNYFTAVLMGAKSDKRAAALLNILDAFSEPYGTAQGIGPVLLSLGRVVFE